MITVVIRKLRSSPYHNTLSTWEKIVDLLSQSNTDARAELKSVAGIASSIIGDKACQATPIIVSCEGPQTRIYCLYDDDAIDGSDANEDVLGFNPLKGDWSMSLPCEADDLTWIQSALSEKTSRIMARDKSDTKIQADASTEDLAALEIDIERLNS
jgi:hypothetical protein